jgi:uncharacterized protein DUF4236
MPIRFRKRPRVGPIQFNITERGLTSWSLRIGPFTWNSRTSGSAGSLEMG